MLRTLLEGHILCEPIEEDQMSRLPLHGNRDIWSTVDRNQRDQRWWWRRGELNPCPKIVSALYLHV